MQDVDRPPHIQAFSEPARRRGSCVRIYPTSGVCLLESAYRIERHRGRRRSVRKWPAIGPAEPERAVQRPIDREALLVDCAVMPATEQNEIREHRGTTVRPVTDVMTLAKRKSAAREATATISMVERSP